MPGRPAAGLKEWTIDPAADAWLNGHCPTYTIPVYPLMALVADLLDGAGAAAHDKIVALADVELSTWIRLDEGPVTLSSKMVTPLDGRVSRQIFGRTGAIDQRIGRATEIESSAYPAAPTQWPDATAGGDHIDPYTSGELFQFDAFHIIRDLVRTCSASLFSFDVGEAITRAKGHAGILLDAVLHGIPHCRPDLWFTGTQHMAALPYRLEHVRFYADLPKDGILTVLSRAAGKPTERTVRSEVQVIQDDAVIMEIELVEALVPLGVNKCIAPADRRPFACSREYRPGWALAKIGANETILSAETVKQANWLPGTLEAVYGLPRKGDVDLEALVETIAVKDHFAIRYRLHPTAIEIEGRCATMGPNRAAMPFTVTWLDKETCQVCDGGSVALLKRKGRQVANNYDVTTFIAHTPEQQALLYNFRYRHYVVERGIFGDIADHGNLTLCEQADHDGTNIAAVKAGEVVGSVRINRWNDPGIRNHMSLLRIEDFMSGRTGEVAVVTRLVSTGAGVLSALMHAVVTITEVQTFRYLFVHCHTGWSSAYRSMGMRLYREGIEAKGLGLGDVLYFDVEDGRAHNEWYRSHAGLSGQVTPTETSETLVAPPLRFGAR